MRQKNRMFHQEGEKRNEKTEEQKGKVISSKKKEQKKKGISIIEYEVGGWILSERKLKRGSS